MRTGTVQARSSKIRDKVTLKDRKVEVPWGDDERVEEIYDYCIDDLSDDTKCCGVIWAANVGSSITSTKDAFALRRAIAHNHSGAEWGLVVCTTIAGRETTPAACIKALREAEFEQLTSFKNPNSNNTVTLWAAKAIK